MKEFNYEKAKAGHPVRTRDNREVEIFKWDARNSFSIFGMIKGKSEDRMAQWDKNGRWSVTGEWDNYDLMLAPKKVERWTNVFKSKTTGKYELKYELNGAYDSEEEARNDTSCNHHWEYVTTKKIEWEE